MSKIPKNLKDIGAPPLCEYICHQPVLPSLNFFSALPRDRARGRRRDFCAVHATVQVTQGALLARNARLACRLRR